VIGRTFVIDLDVLRNVMAIAPFLGSAVLEPHDHCTDIGQYMLSDFGADRSAFVEAGRGLRTPDGR